MEIETEVLDKLYYTIGEVAEMLNTSSSQLRYWSGEFELNVRKNRKGDRLFQKTDLSQLKQIQVLLKDEGYTIEGAKKKLKSKNKTISTDITESSHRNELNTMAFHQVKEKLLAIKTNLLQLKTDIDINI